MDEKNFKTFEEWRNPELNIKHTNKKSKQPTPEEVLADTRLILASLKNGCKTEKKKL